jgi:hypothetical protein
MGVKELKTGGRWPCIICISAARTDRAAEAASKSQHAQRISGRRRRKNTPTADGTKLSFMTFLYLIFLTMMIKNNSQKPVLLPPVQANSDMNNLLKHLTKDVSKEILRNLRGVFGQPESVEAAPTTRGLNAPKRLLAGGTLARLLQTRNPNCRWTPLVSLR